MGWYAQGLFKEPTINFQLPKNLQVVFFGDPARHLRVADDIASFLSYKEIRFANYPVHVHQQLAASRSHAPQDLSGAFERSQVYAAATHMRL